MIENLRFAWRQIYKNPGFAALAILTLALGIGANTAMFTVIDSVMLRPLSFQDGNRIVAITPVSRFQGPTTVSTTSWLNYLDVRDQARQLQAVAAYAVDFGVLHSDQWSESANIVKATAPLFDVLGVRPVLGRAFLSSDNQPGAANVMLLTNRFWRQHFASDPRVMGQQIRLGDTPYTVIGVLPADLSFGGSDASAGVWIPYQPDSPSLTQRNSNFLYLLAKLRPGVSLEAAQSELTAIARGIAQKDPKEAKDLALQMMPYRDVITAQVKSVFVALTGALLLVLLIACANVANLQLARCLARAQELAVRTALGASRGALLTQMLVEGAVLCVAGALVGVGFAEAMLSGVRHLPPDLIPRADEIHLRLSVFLALLAATTVVTLLSSIAPAMVAMRSDPQSVLQAGTRGASASRGRSRLSGAMVAGEVALSVILLVGGGLMFRTLYNLQHMFLGFQEDNITSFIAFPGASAGFFTMKKPEAADQASSIALRIYAPMAEKLRHLPGVVDAAYTNDLPFEGISMETSWGIVGRNTTADQANRNQAFMRAVSGRYLQVMGTPILRGRAINEDDTATSPYVLVINETLAKRDFPGEDPIGKQIEFAKDEKDRQESGMLKPYTIVGIMADSIQTQIAQPPLPELDLPYPQIPIASFFHSILVDPETNFVVKTHGPVAIDSAIRNLFHEAQPSFALDSFQTMKAAHEAADFNQRLGLYLVASFAGIAVIMVLAGLYGVLSQIVGQRQREIGIRMALGADRVSILAMMLRRGLTLIGVGLGVGLLAAVGTERAIKSFLFGVSPIDAITYVGVIALLLLVGTAAAMIPARRAASIEPTEALRAE